MYVKSKSLIFESVLYNTFYSLDIANSNEQDLIILDSTSSE